MCYGIMSVVKPSALLAKTTRPYNYIMGVTVNSLLLWKHYEPWCQAFPSYMCALILWGQKFSLPHLQSLSLLHHKHHNMPLGNCQVKVKHGVCLW